MKAKQKQHRSKKEHKRPVKRKPLKKTQETPGIPWEDLKAKQKAYLDIMHNIVRNPDLGRQYLQSDAAAAQAFRDAGMDVPADIKVVFVRAGDSDNFGTGSAMIELPPVDSNLNAPSDSELLELFLCTYTLQW